LDKQTLKQLKEGLYWEALGGSTGSPPSDVDARLFSLELECRGDREAQVLLAEVKQDLAGKKYRAARALCDELFIALSGDVIHPGIREGIITRQGMWKVVFRPNMADQVAIKERTVKALKDASSLLINDSLEKGLAFNTAVTAQNTAVRLLETARKFAVNQKDIDSQLQNAGKMKANFLCNYGIGVINNAQEQLTNSVNRQMSGGAPSTAAIQEAHTRAVKQIKDGLSFIEQSVKADSQNLHLAQQLKTGKEILATIEAQSSTASTFVSQQSAISLCNRGIERINKAQENLNMEWDILKDSMSSGTTCTAAQDFLKTMAETVQEIEQGVADLLEAKQVDPKNAHISEQLKTGQAILKNVKKQASQISAQLPAYKKGYLC
jgi:hypothetical protein